MNFNDLFIWTCPLCNKRFKSYKSAFNSIFKKYIILDNNNNSTNYNSPNNLRYTIQKININDNYIDSRNTYHYSQVKTPQNKKIDFKNLLSHSLEENKIIKLKSNKIESKKSGKSFLIDILEQRQSSSNNNSKRINKSSNNTNLNSPKSNTQSTTLTEKKSKEINYNEQDNENNLEINIENSLKRKIEKNNENKTNLENEMIKSYQIKTNNEMKKSYESKINLENNEMKKSYESKISLENNEMKKSYESKKILLNENITNEKEEEEEKEEKEEEEKEEEEKEEKEEEEKEEEDEDEIISSSESSNNIKISLTKKLTKFDDDLDEIEKEERDKIGELNDDLGLGISRKQSNQLGNKIEYFSPNKFSNKEKRESGLSLSKFNDDRRGSLVSLSSNSEYSVNFGNIITSPEKLKLIANECFLPEFDADDYEYIEPIGEGAYGKIYSVKNIDNGKKYALKKIICNDLMAINKIQSNLELIYSKEHDHIMKIMGIEYKCLDITTYSLYILMELGISDWNDEIKRRSKKKNYYKEEEIIDILKQIIKPLIFLEKEGIAHRDIKPQNILIFENNIFKVTDFGEAKTLNDTIQNATLRGSELYMSPILYNGLKYNQKNVIHNAFKSDVYSLGLCLLYASSLNSEILTDLREIISMKVISSMISKSIKKYYSKKFINLIVKMLEFDENQRFSFEDIEKYIKENYN